MSKRNRAAKRHARRKQVSDGLARAVEESQRPYRFGLALQTPKEAEQRAREERNRERMRRQAKEAR